MHIIYLFKLIKYLKFAKCYIFLYGDICEDLKEKKIEYTVFTMNSSSIYIYICVRRVCVCM